MPRRSRFTQVKSHSAKALSTPECCGVSLSNNYGHVTPSVDVYNIMYMYVCGALTCLLYTSPSPRDATLSRMPSSA